MNKIMFSSSSDEWATPKWLFKQLDEEFNFTLDPCSSQENHLCDKFFTKAENGLEQSWERETVFCNPPYGRQLPKWIEKCYMEGQKTTVVMLIPARTDTKAFHEFIYNKAEIRFLKGRLHFSESKNAAPFPSMVVVFNPKEV